MTRLEEFIERFVIETGRHPSAVETAIMRIVIDVAYPPPYDWARDGL